MFGCGDGMGWDGVGGVCVFAWHGGRGGEVKLPRLLLE